MCPRRCDVSPAAVAIEVELVAIMRIAGKIHALWGGDLEQSGSFATVREALVASGFEREEPLVPHPEGWHEDSGESLEAP